jgi:hypothetical protein
MLELAYGYGKSDRSICYSCNGLNPPLESNATFEPSPFKLAQLRHYANNSLAFYNQIWTLTF